MVQDMIENLGPASQASGAAGAGKGNGSMIILYPDPATNLFYMCFTSVYRNAFFLLKIPKRHSIY
jgi:hypothetical protein